MVLHPYMVRRKEKAFFNGVWPSTERKAACDKANTTDSSGKFAEEISREFPNSKVIPYPYNVASQEETLVLIDEVLNAFGRLDVWVCSSGLLGPPSIAATTPDDLQRCFEAHSMAPFFALKYAPAAMAKLTEKGTYPNAAPKTQKYGSIIVISSVASIHGGCWGPCYTLASHAALGVVKAGVATLKGTGVRINCISPGQIDMGVDLQGVSAPSPPWINSDDDNSYTVRYAWYDIAIPSSQSSKA